MEAPMNEISQYVMAPLADKFIEVLKNTNDTKIALKEIDADMQVAIEKIRSKGNGINSMIDQIGSSMQTVLNNTSLPTKDKFAFMQQFTQGMLDAIDKY